MEINRGRKSVTRKERLEFGHRTQIPGFPQASDFKVAQKAGAVERDDDP